MTSVVRVEPGTVASFRHAGQATVWPAYSCGTAIFWPQAGQRNRIWGRADAMTIKCHWPGGKAIFIDRFRTGL